MILEAVVLVLMSAVAGVLYRMGGASGYNTKYRDLGIPIVGILLLLGYGSITHTSWVNNTVLCITFILMFASQTTYFKKKGENSRWCNWMLVGLANGLALIPYGIMVGQLEEAILRTWLLAIGITIWSEVNDDAVWEEVGRGVLIVLTLGLLLRWEKKKD